VAYFVHILLVYTLFSLNVLYGQGIDGKVARINNSQKIVDLLGPLQAKGNKIIGKEGTSITLHGMSLFWSQWGGKFYNEQCVQWLYEDWKCTVVRAACGVERGGYLEYPDIELVSIKRVVDACIKLGIYVIVDWHDHRAQDHLKEATGFFKTMAQMYGHTPNIIYEIYNEPLKVSWSQVIKPYADSVIKVIRQYDPDNLIVVGTPVWSQQVDVPAEDPILDPNVAYSFHFYSSEKWHKQNLRDKAIDAFHKGIPIFVTEYGISEANGNGKIDTLETAAWFSFIDEHQLSTCNWSVIDKKETSAALYPGANAKGSWPDSMLSPSGVMIRQRIRTLNTPLFEMIKTNSK
jgi:endoglucanase